MSDLLARLQSPGPKRILTLDGGGIRGSLTLGYLAKVEKVLKEKHPEKKDFKLCDYFDLIAGTSTGSIIATLLALGWSVEDIRKKYFELGGLIFKEKNSFWKFWKWGKALKASYNEAKLVELLKKELKDRTIGHPDLKTGLCIIAKRADSFSTWTLNNHPNDKFYNSDIGTNGSIPLWAVVRASAAAPTYFVPQKVEFGGIEKDGIFVDGGVSTANNPSFLALMMATMKNYSFHWKAGVDDLFMISIGTGYTKEKMAITDVENKWMLGWAKLAPEMLMQDSNKLNQIIMQWISKTHNPTYFDMQLERMEGEQLGPAPLLTYNRYNVLLNKDVLKDLLFTEKDYKSIEHLAEMSNGGNVAILNRIGIAAAEKEIKPEHFPSAFDVK